MAMRAQIPTSALLAFFLSFGTPAWAASIQELGGLKLPLPVPADAFGLEYNPDGGHLAYTSDTNFKDLTEFYRAKLKADGWAESDPLTETDNQETLQFKKDDASLILNITTSDGKKTDFIADSDALAHKGDAIKPMPVKAATLPGASADGAQAADSKPKDASSSAAADAPTSGKPPLPMPDDATDVMYEADGGMLTFNTGKPVKELTEYYRSFAKQKGWEEEASVIQQGNMSVLNFTVNGDDVATITLMTMGAKSMVEAQGPALEAKGGTNEAASAAASGDQPSTSATSGDEAKPLVATEKDGLPIPDGLGNTGSSRTQFSHAVNFMAPNSVADIVAFYRAELSKKGWKEGEAKVSDTAAEIAFTSPEGPAKLTVTRNSDMSEAELSVENKAAAAKSPLAPKPGMVKLVFGNLSDKAADVAIAGKHVKLKPGEGGQAPDGPTLEVKPGKYTATMKGAKPFDFEAGADEIWMVGVGPGGLIAIKQ